MRMLSISNLLLRFSLSIASALCGGFWLICAIPWFFIQKKRPGVPLPKGQSYLTQGWVSTYVLCFWLYVPLLQGYVLTCRFAFYVS